VSHAYCDVGDSIVSKARYLVNKESFDKDRNASTHIAREEMIKDEALMEEFLSCGVNSVEGNDILATQVIQSRYSSLTSISLVQYFVGYGLPYQSRRYTSLSNLSLYQYTIKSELLSSLLVCPMYSHIGFILLCTF
jgi:hypothetical protein